jgi:hypothetical protein
VRNGQGCERGSGTSGIRHAGATARGGTPFARL